MPTPTPRAEIAITMAVAQSIFSVFLPCCCVGGGGIEPPLQPFTRPAQSVLADVSDDLDTDHEPAGNRHQEPDDNNPGADIDRLEHAVSGPPRWPSISAACPSAALQSSNRSGGAPPGCGSGRRRTGRGPASAPPAGPSGTPRPPIPPSASAGSSSRSGGARTRSPTATGGQGQQRSWSGRPIRAPVNLHPPSRWWRCRGSVSQS